MKNNFKNEKGQAILILVMIIGASMLSISTIAGFVTTQKIRSVTDSRDSVKAIYAADSGIECFLYNRFYLEVAGLDPLDCNQITFENQASVEVGLGQGGYDIKSIGQAGRTSRAFGLDLTAIENP